MHLDSKEYGLPHFHQMPEYKTYHSAKRRCNCEKATNYKWYGGRGIKFLFDNFIQFYNEVGPKPSPKHSIDRINYDGNYEPGNVRWADSATQHANCRDFRSIRLTHNGKTQKLSEWSKDFNIKSGTLYKRYFYHKMRGDRLFSPVEDSAIYRQKGMCKRGHLMSGDNLKYTKDGRRTCAGCRKFWDKERSRNKKNSPL